MAVIPTVSVKGDVKACISSLADSSREGVAAGAFASGGCPVVTADSCASSGRQGIAAISLARRNRDISVAAETLQGRLLARLPRARGIGLSRMGYRPHGSGSGWEFRATTAAGREHGTLIFREMGIPRIPQSAPDWGWVGSGTGR